jgi:hypothetical protein
MAIVRNGSFLLAAGAVGLTLVLAPIQANAAASSSITATGPTFTLYDLDPTDDLQPSYRLGEQAESVFVSVSASTANQGVLGEATEVSRQPVSRSIDASGVVVSASAENGVFSASGSTFGTAIDSSYWADMNVSEGAPFWGGVDLELSPRSLLVISMWVDASATIDQVVCPAQWAPDQGIYGCNSQQAAASASLTLKYSYASDGSTVSASLDDFVSVGGDVTPVQNVSWPPGQLPVVTWTVGPGFDEHETRLLSVVFMNVSDEAQVAKLGVYVSAYGHGMLQVPETATANMMALGLGGLAVVALRRRQRT